MKSVIFFFLSLLVLPAFALQEYMSADGTATPVPSGPAASVPMNVPAVTQAEAMNIQSSAPPAPMNVPAVTQAEAMNIQSSSQSASMNVPPAEGMNVQSSAQSQAMNASAPAQSSSPIYVTPAQTQVAQNTVQQIEIAYSATEQQEWFKSCMTAQKDQRVTKYAQEYCQCSWDQIIKIIPAKNLIAEDAKIMEATNGLLRSISSQCVIQVLANHGEIT
jgi:hypothetical protein